MLQGDTEKELQFEMFPNGPTLLKVQFYRFTAAAASIEVVTHRSTSSKIAS